jgi:hypothetical protein
MKIDFLFTWSKGEEENLKSIGGGFKLPPPFSWIGSLFKS